MTDHLTHLEQLLLLSLLRLGEEAWGTAIQDDLEKVAERPVSLGSIHVTLGRLEERGLVASAKGEPTRERGGKARRMYAITDAGRSTLMRSREILERMWEGVPAESGG